MPTLTITGSGTRDYQSAPLDSQVTGQSITAIDFATSGGASALFLTSQFGGTNISNSVSIDGSANADTLAIHGSIGILTFSAALWTFTSGNAPEVIRFVDNNGDNSWTGTGRNDTFNDGAGNDTYLGGDGIDIFSFSNLSSGNDSINGGAGVRDLLQYTNLTQGVAVNLQAGTATGASIGNDLFTQIEYVSGGNGNDTLTGDAGANSLLGDKGNDILDGGGGLDSLIGGEGDDQYYIDNAGVTLTESSFSTTGGYDIVYSRVNFVLPQYFEDLYLIGAVSQGEGTDEENVIDARGAAVATTLKGHEGDDKLFGSALADTITGGLGLDTLVGGAGADWLYGLSDTGQDSEVDFDFASYETATTAIAVDLDPGFGVTYGIGTLGDASFDRLFSIEGLIGSGFGDTMKGNGVANSLLGGGGNDSLEGRGGNDILNGGDNNDTLDGGANDDNLYGGAGADSLIGGTGFDIVRYDDAWGVQVDILFSNAFGSFAQGDTFSGIEGVSGSNTDDGVWGTNENNTIFTWLGNDYIDGRGGVDVLLGGANNDTLVGGADADYLAGEAGADVFRYLALTDSGPTAQDYLPDFSSAQGDRIDISALRGGTPATFNMGFGTGNSVYAFSQSGGAWTMVQFYQGATLHLQIVVNVSSMTAGDFIL